MKEIRITRAFLKKPLNSLTTLFILIATLEVLQWSIGYHWKKKFMLQVGGLSPYIGMIIRDIFLPEVVTLFVIVRSLDLHHKFFKLYTVKYDRFSITKYELGFLPLLLVIFLFFNPFTQTVRFFLEAYPEYSWAKYWNEYILYTYSWHTYFQYLFPLILLGYISLNISLLQDYLNQRKEVAEREAVDNFRKTLQSSDKSDASATFPTTYLTSLKGRNAQGELDFPVNDAYYFTIEERLYYAELAKGRYLISKTLNELEAELDPRQFFRIKRDYIVNRQAILSYAHWENGKYIVRLNTPKSQDIVIPRTRMQELREWLQKDSKELLELS